MLIVGSQFSCFCFHHCTAKAPYETTWVSARNKQLVKAGLNEHQKCNQNRDQERNVTVFANRDILSGIRTFESF